MKIWNHEKRIIQELYSDERHMGMTTNEKNNSAVVNEKEKIGGETLLEKMLNKIYSSYGAGRILGRNKVLWSEFNQIQILYVSCRDKMDNGMKEIRDIALDKSGLSDEDKKKKIEQKFEEVEALVKEMEGINKEKNEILEKLDKNLKGKK